MSFSIISIIILMLNAMCGVIAGIWLIILGEWRIVIRGIIFLLVSGLAISFVLMPGLLLAGPAMLAIEKGRKYLGMFLCSLSVLYTVALITVWCIWIMWGFINSATERTFIPMLIWSYGIALAPWMWLAQKDQQGDNRNEYSLVTTFFAQISYIIGIVLFFMGFNLGTVATTFGIIMASCAALQVYAVCGEAQ